MMITDDFQLLRYSKLAETHSDVSIDPERGPADELRLECMDLPTMKSSAFTHESVIRWKRRFCRVGKDWGHDE